jgi:hypothetical protein
MLQWRKVLPRTNVNVIWNCNSMETIDLEPRYSSCDMTGKCVRCLAQEELTKCIVEMLGDVEDDSLQKRYNILVAFLESPETQKLINETEQLLSEGKKVKLKLLFEDNQLRFETQIE